MAPHRKSQLRKSTPKSPHDARRHDPAAARRFVTALEDTLGEQNPDGLGAYGRLVKVKSEAGVEHAATDSPEDAT